MFWFHYDVMQPKFGADNLKMCMTDTDSFMYHITCKNLYKQLEDLQEHLDTSDYPKEHPLFSDKNKKALGKFKDECNGQPIREATCLRAKNYIFVIACLYWFDYTSRLRNPICCAKDEERVKCKGINKAVSKQLTAKDFKATVLEGETKCVDMISFRSYDHTIYTQTQNKVALSPYDDKRFMLEDAVHTRPHGHWRNSRAPQ